MDANDMGSFSQGDPHYDRAAATRIGELAAQIDADYADRELLFVGVLKGAVMVMADLARALHLPVEMDWMASRRTGRRARVPIEGSCDIAPRIKATYPRPTYQAPRSPCKRRRRPSRG